MTQATGESGQSIDSPLSNTQYNLMQALVSKLEAIEVYQKYSKDGGSQSGMWERLIGEERSHAEELLNALRQELGGGESGGSSSGMGSGGSSASSNG
jgi:rubrerythrin